MKNWLNNWKNRRRSFDLEHALRAERPTPPEHLVKSIATDVRRRRPVRVGLPAARLGRVAVVVAVAGALLVGSSLAAGLGPAGALHLSSIIGNTPPHSAPQSAPIASAADEYTGSPTITGFSPSSGLVGSTVAISGTNFGATTFVRFNGTSASFSVNSGTSITATVPSGATNGPISVANHGGTATSADSFTVIQTPAVSSFTPTFGPVGTSVTIIGSHFTGTTAVKFNLTTASTFAVDSDTQITATVPTGATTGQITVTNPAGSAKSADKFTVANEATPVISNFTPTSGKVGTSVTINGSHFTGATEVDFNGTPAASITVSGDTKITTKVPAGATTGQITVVNGAGSTDSAGDFTVIVAPSISSFTPTSGAAGKLVTINGSGFTGATAVKFGTATASFTPVNDGQLTATVPATAKTGPISVVNPAGTATSTGVFTVATNAPKVTSFSPAFGAVGTSVTITGTNLTNTTNVQFGTTSATSFTVNSDTSVTATLPSIAPVAGGTNVPVTVVTDTGAGTSTAKFSVIEPPHITSFSPASGLVGSTVKITGSGFLGTGKTSGDFVKFGGVSATFTVTNDTTISAKVPSGASTGTISVKNAANSDTSVDSFVVPTNPPAIAGFSPASGLAGHTLVAITGTDLDGATKVTFNGKAATNVTSDTSGEIDVVVPAGATTGPIAVTTAKGTTSTGTTKFTVDATPKVTGFVPAQGAVGDSIAITGSGFEPTEGATVLSDDTVKFNGTTSTSVTVNSDSSITATVPVGATSGKISVANHYGDTGTSTASFTVVVAPSITSFSPASGLANASVTINGSGFLGTVGAGGVQFGSTNASYTVNSDTKITAKVPASLAPGSYPITVTNAANNATSATDFVVPGNPPAIASFSPTSGLAGHTAVTITGTDLGGATKVTFNGKPATITSNSSGTIQVTVPAGATTGSIAVTTAKGMASTGTTKFTVDGTPKVTGFSVAADQSGHSITITGSGFDPVETGGAGALPDDTVTFNGAAPVSVTATDDGDITVQIPVDATTGKVTVANHYGDTGTSTKAFTVFQQPLITSFSPGSAKVGATVTILGSGFTGTSDVEFGSTPTTFTVNNDGKITTKVPTGATTGFITVTNPVNTATSLSAFVVPTGAPDITSLTPDNGPASSQAGTTVTIGGDHLRGATKVTFNGKPAASVAVVDDNTIVAVTPTAGATTGPVSVTTPAGTASSLPLKFTVNAPPKVTGLSVSSGVAGTTSVTITGSGFLAKEGSGPADDHVTVTFGTGSVATTATDDGDITVTVPNNATTGKVTVANNFGETGTSTMVFTVIVAPHITTFTPGSGKTGSMVTLTGTGFAGTSSVTFENTDTLVDTTTTYTVTGDTKITAKVPTTLTAGSYTITVTNAANSDTTASDFVVTTAAPTIHSFTPSDGSAASTAVQSALTITGTGFLGTNKVTVNGKVQSLVSVDSDTQITVTLAAGTTSGPIAITTPSGTASTSGGVLCGGSVGSPGPGTCTKFTVDPPPVVKSFTPSAGVGETLTITGTGFLSSFNGVALDNETTVSVNGTDAPGLQITCGGNSCAPDTPNTATTVITVDVPDGATSGPITVTNGWGESFTTTTVFTVIAPPSITSFSPTSGAVGDPVTISGSGFSGATEVDFNGTPQTAITVDNDGQITTTVPTGATTGEITVVKPHGSGTSSTDFTVTP